MPLKTGRGKCPSPTPVEPWCCSVSVSVHLTTDVKDSTPIKRQIGWLRVHLERSVEAEELMYWCCQVSSGPAARCSSTRTSVDPLHPQSTPNVAWQIRLCWSRLRRPRRAVSVQLAFERTRAHGLCLGLAMKLANPVTNSITVLKQTNNISYIPLYQ